MFKLALALFVAVASAADTEAPVISMDFPMHTLNCPDIVETYIDSAGSTTSDLATNGQMCEMECSAVSARSTTTNCKEPTVSAFDHHDGDLSSSITAVIKAPNKTEIFSGNWVDVKSSCSTKGTDCNGDGSFDDWSLIDFNQLGTWEIVFTVCDAAGNCNSATNAHDNVYIHVVDHEAPEYTWYGSSLQSSTEDVECACAASSELDGAHSIPNLTSTVHQSFSEEQSQLNYSYRLQGNATHWNDWVTGIDAEGSDVTTQNSGWPLSICPRVNGNMVVSGQQRVQVDYELSAFAQDANMDLDGGGRYWGADPPSLSDNVGVTLSRTIHVEDTTPPVVETLDWQTVYHECGNEYQYDKRTPATDDQYDVENNAGYDTLSTTDGCTDDADLTRTLTVNTKEAIGVGNTDSTWDWLNGKWPKTGQADQGEFTGRNDSRATEEITFKVEDKANLEDVAVRTVIWQDTAAPDFSFHKANNDTYPTNALSGTICVGGTCAFHVKCIKGGSCDQVMPRCTDLCSSSHHASNPTGVPANLMTDGGLDASTEGEYVYDYNCTDAAGNVEKMSVVYQVISHDTPVISLIQPDSTDTVEASNTATYTDPGATCVTGNTDISHVVRTKGDVVDLSTVGYYTVTYTCKNPYANANSTQTRTIRVRDNTCPELKVCPATNYNCTFADASTPGEEITIEAGFPYTDAGANAQDSFSNNASNNGVHGPFDVPVHKENYDTPQSWEMYHSTEYNHSTVCNPENPDGYHQIGGLEMYCYSGHTYHKFDNLAFIDLHGENSSSPSCSVEHTGATCEDMAGGNWSTPDCATLTNTTFEEFVSSSTAAFNGRAFNHYPCVANFENGVNHLVWFHEDDDYLAQVGTYKITFTATDSMGNTNDGSCLNSNADVIRTIFVNDTLPPVITLRANGQTYPTAVRTPETGVAWVSNSSGLTTSTNPAYLQNPFRTFMAEQTSVNGWMAGALASFVAGVALVSYSSKGESHSVPV